MWKLKGRITLNSKFWKKQQETSPLSFPSMHGNSQITKEICGVLIAYVLKWHLKKIMKRTETVLFICFLSELAEKVMPESVIRILNEFTSSIFCYAINCLKFNLLGKWPFLDNIFYKEFIINICCNVKQSWINMDLNW